jgi:hypothetical protein
VAPEINTVFAPIPCPEALLRPITERPLAIVLLYSGRQLSVRADEPMMESHYCSAKRSGSGVDEDAKRKTIVTELQMGTNKYSSTAQLRVCQESRLKSKDLPAEH